MDQHPILVEKYHSSLSPTCFLLWKKHSCANHTVLYPDNAASFTKKTCVHNHPLKGDNADSSNCYKIVYIITIPFTIMRWIMMVSGGMQIRVFLNKNIESTFAETRGSNLHLFHVASISPRASYSFKGILKLFTMFLWGLQIFCTWLDHIELQVVWWTRAVHARV